MTRINQFALSMRAKLLGTLLICAMVWVPTLGFAAGASVLPFGHAGTTPTDPVVLQKGAKVYFNYCAGCHSLEYMRYGRLAKDLQLSEELVLENFNHTGAKPGDLIKVAMPKALGEQWFGKAPPDLSLVARARGTDWVYNYLLSFYPDAKRPMGWNNVVFPGASMPHVLWKYEGVKQAEFAEKGADGHCANGEVDGKCFEKFGAAVGGSLNTTEYQDSMLALTSFLEYVGEPAIIERRSLGVWVLFYLVLFTLVAYLLKSEYWKDVH